MLVSTDNKYRSDDRLLGGVRDDVQSGFRSMGGTPSTFEDDLDGITSGEGA
jgi:hypothetical protein